MAETNRPLSRLCAGDPRNNLSNSARRRIDKAHSEATLIQHRALVEIEAEHTRQSPGGESFHDFLDSGKGRAMWQEANLRAARTVLQACLAEYRGAGLNPPQVGAAMKDELEGAVNSLELTHIQRRLLDLEIVLAPEGADEIQPTQQAGAREPSGNEPIRTEAVPAVNATILNSRGQGRKRGPKPDYETAGRVAEVIARVAPDGHWSLNLDDVLMALDDAQIPTPKTWLVKHGYRNWYAAVAGDNAGRGRHMAIEAIKHHLKRAKEKPTETIP